ncbi:MAG TPA: AraC family transcriptional regulator [Acidobacteriaceae bacterium]|nr:AraC family transcriptional regulator [Acidobacteriaceae bacterium]
MDPLSDVLSLLKPSGYLSGGFDVGAPWSIRFGQHHGIKCYSVVSGECWLAVDSVADAVHLRAGDCLLLPRGWPFRLASDLAVPPVDALSILKDKPRNGHIGTYNGGGSCLMLGGFFGFDGDHAGILLGVLPPIVHLQKEEDKAALRWSLDQMRQELHQQQPGSVLIAQQLAYMMLVTALRLCLAEGVKGGIGWLYALADKQIAAAISAMHEQPARRWTLQKLAQRAGMSRSIFAQRFRQTVGEPAMEYLTRWRMLLAGDRLKNSGDGISAIALSLGYESESAFGKAFKRIMGCSPRQYKRGCVPVTASTDQDEDVRADQLTAIAG